MTSTASAVGVDVGGTKIAALGVGADGQISARVSAPTPSADAEAAVAAIADAVARLGIAGPVGVGLPGLIDADGVLRSGANVTWRDVPFRERLRQVLGRPVSLDNDCTAGAYGEVRVGAARGSRDVIYVGVGTGIGGGLVLGGRIYRGANGFAGEIGHVIVEPDGEVCGCGNRGCWETVASGSTIERDGRTAVTRHAHSMIAELAGGDPSRVDGAMVTHAAEAGDPTARGILAEVGTRLGQGLAGLINTFDPQAVVVGGGVAEAGDLLLAPARASCVAAVQGEDRPEVPIVPAALGEDSAAVGAALLALDDEASR
jgi:glucokinase